MKQKIVISRAIPPSVVEKLRAVFEVVDNPSDQVFTPEELTQRLQGAAGLMAVGGTKVNEALLAACPDLKIAANMAVGYDNLDVAACAARGVVCTNTPDVLTESTADMGFALLMAAARRVSEAEAFLRGGEWNRWSYDMLAGPDVYGSTLAILGMGRIGQAIAKRGAHGFGMNVIYHNRSRLSAELEGACKARYVSRDELFAQADHLVIVMPFSKAAYHTVGKDELAQMKPSATLVNIARGGLIDEPALMDALQNGRLAAAGLDVFEGEPKFNPDWLKLKNVVLTPHIGSATVKTRTAMASLAAENLIAYLTKGQAITPIQP